MSACFWPALLLSCSFPRRSGAEREILWSDKSASAQREGWISTIPQVSKSLPAIPLACIQPWPQDRDQWALRRSMTCSSLDLTERQKELFEKYLPIIHHRRPSSIALRTKALICINGTALPRVPEVSSSRLEAAWRGTSRSQRSWPSHWDVVWSVAAPPAEMNLPGRLSPLACGCLLISKDRALALGQLAGPRGPIAAGDARRKRQLPRATAKTRSRPVPVLLRSPARSFPPLPPRRGPRRRGGRWAAGPGAGRGARSAGGRAGALFDLLVVQARGLCGALAAARMAFRESQAMEV